MTKRRTTEEFKEILSNKFGNQFDVLSEYVDNTTKIKLRCNKCGNIIYKSPCKMTGAISEGCYICSGKNHYKTKDTLQSEVDIRYPDTYIIVGDYVKARQPLEVLNKRCGHSYNISPDNLLRGKGCPLCRQSSYEDYVDEYMKIHHPSFVKQKKYDDLRSESGRLLMFDYYIPEYDLCIEIDGQFHYYNEYWKDRDDFLTTYYNVKANDKIKNEYCDNHNIPLLRIKYDRIKNIDLIIKNKINANSEIT